MSPAELHAEIYRQARRGEISLEEMLRQSEAMQKRYKSGPNKLRQRVSAVEKWLRIED